MARLPNYKATVVSLILWIAILWSTSCQRRQVAVPLPAPPAPSARRPAPEPEPLPSPPAISTPAPSTSPAPPLVQAHEPPITYQVNKPPQAAAKKPSRPAPSPTPAAAPSPFPAAASSPSPAASAPAPKLGDVLTDDQEKQYSASIDQSLSRADVSLNALNGRQLNKDQQSEVEQIRSFMQQAKSTRTSDPAGAKSLAERAEVLARDLAASFK